MHKQLFGWSAVSLLCLGGTLVACSSSPGSSGYQFNAGGAPAGGAPAQSAGAPSAAAGAATTGGGSGAVALGGSSNGAGSPGAAGAGGASGNAAGSAGGGNAGGAGSAGASGGAAGASGSAGAGAGGGSSTTPNRKLVAYLANYSGSFTDWAKKVNFNKMTHLNLAFATVSNGTQWNIGQSDAEVKAIVDAAHAAGVKVLASLGGGGGDGSIFNNWGNLDGMVNTLDPFLKRLNLDGADIDIENPQQTGSINSTNATNYDKFVEAIVAKLHPEGKLVTAAVAPWVGGPRVSTLQQFDFVNIMVYTSKLSDYTDGANFFKIIGNDKITIGAGFYGANAGDTNEVAYSQILAADPSAYTKNQAQVNGETFYYTGEDAMKSIVALAKNYGGLMVWDLTEDVTGSHSLWSLVQNNF